MTYSKLITKRETLNNDLLPTCIVRIILKNFNFEFFMKYFNSKSFSAEREQGTSFKTRNIFTTISHVYINKMLLDLPWDHVVVPGPARLALLLSSFNLKIIFVTFSNLFMAVSLTY